MKTPSVAKPQTTNRTSQTAYRLSNTKEPITKLMHSDTALLLQNALIDTANGAALSIPESLRAAGDPGSYIVQSRGPLDSAFRTLLKGAGATVVAYVPNNAYLVQANRSRGAAD